MRFILIVLHIMNPEGTLEN